MASSANSDGRSGVYWARRFAVRSNPAASATRSDSFNILDRIRPRDSGYLLISAGKSGPRIGSSAADQATNSTGFAPTAASTTPGATVGQRGSSGVSPASTPAARTRFPGPAFGPVSIDHNPGAIVAA